MITIIITGIGGDVGVGCARNLRREFGEAIELIGTNTAPNPSGGYLCNWLYEVERADDPAYLSQMKGLIQKHNAGLLIPCTDLETLILSGEDLQLPVAVATSPRETVEQMYDKWQTAKLFQDLGLPFVPGMLATDYDGSYEEWLLKPRIGNGSRGIQGPCKGELGSASADCIVQPFVKAQEYTVAFYVKQDSTILGSITFRRELAGGRTVACEVDPAMDERVMREIVLPLTSKVKFKGPANLQFFVDEEGGILPFEVNCRFSGTSSLRSAFGFNDVSFLVREWIMEEPLEPPVIRTGSAVRVSSDVIFYEGGLDDTKTQSNDPILW